VNSAGTRHPTAGANPCQSPVWPGVGPHAFGHEFSPVICSCHQQLPLPHRHATMLAAFHDKTIVSSAPAVAAAASWRPLLRLPGFWNGKPHSVVSKQPSACPGDFPRLPGPRPFLDPELCIVPSSSPSLVGSDWAPDLESTTMGRHLSTCVYLTRLGGVATLVESTSKHSTWMMTWCTLLFLIGTRRELCKHLYTPQIRDTSA
jgi:hypothetical protein